MPVQRNWLGAGYEKHIHMVDNLVLAPPLPDCTREALRKYTVCADVEFGIRISYWTLFVELPVAKVAVTVCQLVLSGTVVEVASVLPFHRSR